MEISKYNGGTWQRVTDLLTPEEPLQIRLRQRGVSKSLAITMRTPGEDAALALGFCFTEGIIGDPDDVRRVAVGDAGAAATRNVVTVELHDHVAVGWQDLERHGYVSSSCGVCGKTSLDQVHQSLPARVPQRPFTVAAALIPTLPDRLREHQTWFDRTGGIHAAGLFTSTGKLLALAEDVGRHNALDKLIGARLLAEVEATAGERSSSALPLTSSPRHPRARQKKLPEHNDPKDGRVLVLSGRASFELIQKAAMAGITFVVAVGAPSTLAVELARDQGMTLCGFARGDRFNCYAGPERIDVNFPPPPVL